ncbi:MAG: UPF0149 family protein [Rhodanobacteraceae bacterium]
MNRNPGISKISYAEFSKAVAQAKLGTSPAELHGSIAGYLCAGGSGRANDLLPSLQLEGDGAGVLAPLRPLLEELAAGMSRDLRDGTAVTPLLPEAPLAARADGMVEWCRGFLGGLGLTGALRSSAIDPDARELLDAFGQIASMRIECDEGEEGELADVLEFIRGGMVQLRAALARAQRR